MSLLIKSVPITTIADGSDTTTVRLGSCRIHAIRLELGTLSTPDITITEQPGNTGILAVSGVATDKTWYPTVLGSNGSGVDVVGAANPIPVFDRIQVVVAGGGDALTGRLIFMYEH